MQQNAIAQSRAVIELKEHLTNATERPQNAERTLGDVHDNKSKDQGGLGPKRDKLQYVNKKSARKFINSIETICINQEYEK